MKLVIFFQTICLRVQTKPNSLRILHPRREGNTGLSYGHIVDFSTETEVSKFGKIVTLHKRKAQEAY